MDNQNTNTTVRQVTFTSRLLDISAHLHSLDGGERYDLHGIVLPLLGLDAGLFTVGLISENGEKRIAETDELGRFEFRELTGNVGRLTVTGPGFEITMSTAIWTGA